MLTRMLLLLMLLLCVRMLLLLQQLLLLCLWSLVELLVAAASHSAAIRAVACSADADLTAAHLNGTFGFWLVGWKLRQQFGRFQILLGWRAGGANTRGCNGNDGAKCVNAGICANTYWLLWRRNSTNRDKQTMPNRINARNIRIKSVGEMSALKWSVEPFTTRAWNEPRMQWLGL